MNKIRQNTKRKKKLQSITAERSASVSSGQPILIILYFVPVLRIEGLIDFIEEIKGSGIAFLDGENEGESDEGFLTARKLIHLPHFRLLTGEGNLQNHSDTTKHTFESSSHLWLLRHGPYARLAKRIIATGLQSKCIYPYQSHKFK